MMVRRRDTVPDFTQASTQGPPNFHRWGEWVVIEALRLADDRGLSRCLFLREDRAWIVGGV